LKTPSVKEKLKTRATGKIKNRSTVKLFQFRQAIMKRFGLIVKTIFSARRLLPIKFFPVRLLQPFGKRKQPPASEFRLARATLLSVRAADL